MTTHQPTPSSSEPARQLDALQHELDQAQTSAKRWRRLYEVEAQQRQNEAEVAEQTIQGLRAEIQRLCQFSSSSGASVLMSAPRQSEGSSNSDSRLHNQIANLIAERDQLLQALEQEQRNHEKTKENLIRALGDALGAQKRKRSLVLPSSRAGARAGAIILKDRDGRRVKPD